MIEHSFHFKRSAEKDSFSDASVMKQLIHPSTGSEISWLEVRTMIKASVLFSVVVDCGVDLMRRGASRIIII